MAHKSLQSPIVLFRSDSQDPWEHIVIILNSQVLSDECENVVLTAAEVNKTFKKAEIASGRSFDVSIPENEHVLHFLQKLSECGKIILKEEEILI